MRGNFINSKYRVEFDGYTKNHFIKNFKKKYKNKWDITEQSIINSLERISNLQKEDVIDIICNSNCGTIIMKYDFVLAGSGKSAKAGGNRCILSVCNKSLLVRVLLVYSKDNIQTRSNETNWWKEIISSEFDIHCS